MQSQFIDNMAEEKQNCYEPLYYILLESYAYILRDIYVQVYRYVHLHLYVHAPGTSILRLLTVALKVVFEQS